MKVQILGFLLFLLFFSDDSQSQTFDTTFYSSLTYRTIGPYRGGRSAAVTGVRGNPNLFYFGSTGGGVWRTRDGGNTWENISDGYFGGSIGAVAVAESDPNVIYAGGGEKTVRSNVSSGYGMYRSEDAGKTWRFIGLPESRHISRIRIHPQNPDIVYVAVMGNLYLGHPERGVYKTVDGGKNWKKVLFANPDAGAVDLCLDPTNPRIMYASTWRIRRTPYSLSSGGDGSALWKSTDSGETWVEISRNQGLPKETLGIIGIAVSPLDPDRIWAIIEAANGGVFRSDDGGKIWTKLNDDRSLRQRAWYYSRIYADTRDKNTVYVLNVNYHKSTDGGKTFTSHSAPHGDHHDLWIDPLDNQRMIIGDDGGAQVSYDGGENWSTYYNQPTAQFYRVTTDNHFPYRIYVAQQDNSTIRIPHRTMSNSIDLAHWQESAGCECGHMAVDPLDNEIVYGGCYGGVLERYNHRIEQGREVGVWPDNPMGHGAEGMRYRIQWNYPIFFSPHNPKKLYTASNHLHVSYNNGESWEVISPDLTRNDSSKLGPSGGPITKDNTSVEYYCTIFAAAESPRVKDLLWTGSDDGLIHVSRDGGTNWLNVTPKNMPEWIMINSIEPDPHTDGGCYVAATMYKSGDFRPYLFRTKDYGQSWTKITGGIHPSHFTRVVRCDPKLPGLLYCGTEAGMYISFDDGQNWTSFQLNLPIVPITDLAVKENNLIVATQGRSLWILDDLTPLYSNNNLKQDQVYLFPVKPTYRMRGTQTKMLKTAGTNHAPGVTFHYFLPEINDSSEVSFTIRDNKGGIIRTFSSKKEKDEKLEFKKGANQFNWNLQYPPAERFDGLILWAGSLAGPVALPGIYTAVLAVNGSEQSQPFEIRQDPRSEATPEELETQFNFVHEVNTKISEVHLIIKEIRDIRQKLSELEPLLNGTTDAENLKKLSKDLREKITAVEERLYQTKNKSNQDPLNFPIRLNNKLAYLNTITRNGDYAPTRQAIEVKKEITDLIDHELKQIREIFHTDLPRFNASFKNLNLDPLIIKKSESTSGKP